MGLHLTSGAISKILTSKCTENDLKPVLQVVYIESHMKFDTDNKQWYGVVFSDGASSQIGLIADEIIISKELQKGSIVQLTKFQVAKLTTDIMTTRCIAVFNLTVIHSECGIIDEDHVEEPPTSKQKQDHVDSLMNEDIDDSHRVAETPTSIQNPSTSTQKCSSHSPTQNKKRKLLSSDDDIISGFGKDISKLVSMIVEKTIEDGLGVCYKKLGTLEKGVSKMTRMMMAKNKEDDVGFKKLETLEQDVSKMTKLMTGKSKEVDAGFKKLETLEQDVSKMTIHVVGFKKLETLEENVSKMAKMMMEKNKEDVVGFNKLEKLEEDVSKMTRMMMEKNEEDVMGFKKLKTLEEDVSIMMRMMIEKNKEDNAGACSKKLETLEEDVSKMAKMMIEKNKEDDMGACIEKLDKMGWGAEEPMYDTALLLFLKGADYRKLWLHLKPECCGKWVKNAGSIFGLLD